VLTVSESSSATILRFVDVEPENRRDSITPYRRALRIEPLEEDVVRVREPVGTSARRIRTVRRAIVRPHKESERLIEAFHIVRRHNLDHLKLG